MIFFRLTHPFYGSDQVDDRANPIRVINANWIPGLICSKCGSTWAGTRRLYLPLNSPHITKFLNLPPLPESDWKSNLREIRKILGLSESFELRPGDRLGIPEFELRRNKFNKIMHPFPGQIIVTEEVNHVLEEAKVTGYSLIKANIRWGKSIKNKSDNTPTLYELIINGHAWRENSSDEKSIACEHCRRHIFPNPHNLTVDIGRWDGSDMFTLGLNPHYVIVTERVCAVLNSHGFGNFICIPIP
jgi:Protein of unknown function (Gmx_para_CXXCG)